ncbi:hypothetical protein CONCODRAFT_2671 [Conidiobolus coronatus NRRL 28638]|uniref:G-protein coupled receptors family 1 profile domain-containing protein n=1 Tax=Conidiobolus coronatus (strain ATCC 28846 / CBS 209.66 / NRRL 28638) TaxID=796925 RepID=A0A137PH31_CONC2|nr:hypothetical protein CONCODRAFT_2671 [Conidiobolus coronatus NRRL 28638]|eukprot:KXN74292.1 hypothetical protein CONCODRAFT_2671 [Conidiobolus coronatus NRRL 28638]
MNQSEYKNNLGEGILILDTLEIIVGAIGILANALTIYILVSKMRLRGADTIQSFILAILDILFSMFTVINCICIWKSNHSLMLNDNYYVQLVGFIFYSMGPCVMDSIMILALIRYLGICKQIQLSNLSWIVITLLFIIFDFTIGLNCLVESNYVTQPSLKYAAVEFNSQLGWKNNLYYFTIWVKLTINVVVILVSYLFISLHYYNYLKSMDSSINLSNINRNSKSYSYDIEKVDSLPRVNIDNSYSFQNDSNYTAGSEFALYKGDAGIRSSPSVSNTSINNDKYTTITNQETRMTRLIKSSQIKLYIILTVYVVEILPFFLYQFVFKFFNIRNTPLSDSLASFLTHLVPVTNPCFVLFCNFETYQELVNTVYSIYYKLFN